MRTSLIIGLIMLWLIIAGLEFMVDNPAAAAGTAIMSSTNNDTATTLMSAGKFVSSGNVFTTAWTIITDAAPAFQAIIKVIFLWSPSIFAGYMVYFWYIFCLPISIGFIISLIFVARGVHSS